MKTFYNKDENYVNEMLEGIINAHLNLLKKVNGEIRAIARAKWFSNRSLGIIDPGAFSGYLIIKTIGEFILEKMNE
jgi:dihydroxyacetone kinase